MGWEKKVLTTFTNKKGTVDKVGKPKSNGYVDIELDNGDTGTYFAKFDTLSVKDAITYDLEKAEMSNGEDSFNTNSIINVIKDVVESSTPLRVLRELDPTRLMFIDIETVGVHKQIKKGTPIYEAWEYKNRREEFTTQKQLKEAFEKKAGLYAEFGKIVCISIGYLKDNELSIKSFYGDDEKQILKDFFAMYGKVSRTFPKLVGFASNQFDIPFIIKRSLVNGLSVPDVIDVSGLKPWEVGHLDLKDVFKLTGWETPSLTTLAYALGVPTSKGGEVEGSNVSEFYYGTDEDRLEKIMKYCEKDVAVTANIFLKMMLLKPISYYQSKTTDAKIEL